MARGGWIKLWRGLSDHPLWLEKPFSKGQAWVDLLLLVQGQDNEGLDRYGNFIKFECGKAYKSISYLAGRWGWSKPRVQRFLENLEKANMLSVESRARHGTTITLVNWGKFQDRYTRGDTRHDTRDVTNGVPEALLNKEVKEVKEEKNVRADDPLPLDAEWSPPEEGTAEYERWRNQ